jgi:hypothetical protein
VENMKTICVGGDLAGFPEESHVFKATGLATLVADHDPVVLVCHGLSIYERESDVSFKISPALSNYHLQAVAIAHRDHGAASSELEQVRKDLGNQCKRVFGLTRGWEGLKDSQRDLIIEFLESSESAPSSPEVQKLLGFDSPVSRLALRVALEIALREFGGEAPGKRLGNALPVETLLAPVLAIAEQEPSLAHEVSRISQALATDRKSLRHEITQALSELRS